MEREVRNLYAHKSVRSPKISKGAPRPSDLKDGESVKRFVNGELIEYTKYGAKLFANKYHELSNATPTRGSRSAVGKNFSTTPNWDSGWFAISRDNTYYLDHFLGTRFLMITTYFKESGGEIYQYTNSHVHEMKDSPTNEDTGITFRIYDRNRIILGTADYAVFQRQNTDDGGDDYADLTSGHLRLFAWAIFPPLSADPN